MGLVLSNTKEGVNLLIKEPTSNSLRKMEKIVYGTLSVFKLND